jgi:hypothetical protein
MVATDAGGSEQAHNGEQFKARPYLSTDSAIAFRTWFWALIPLLTILAYITAVRVGFLKDDLQYLIDAENHGFDLGKLINEDAQLQYGNFYRPIGIVLTWRLGWYLWGANPFPYHLQSVFIHACAALLIGLWVAQVSGRRSLGWLTGTLFGVWPLHTEAVAWLSAQWDALAVLFGMSSLLLFTGWWRATTPTWTSYAASLALYVAALYTKESMRSFIAMFALAAWCITPGFNRQVLRRLGLALAPFFIALLGVLALRFMFWGQVGGYRWARVDFTEFLWDRLIEDARLLIAPINPAVVGSSTTQIIGAIASILLMAGLIAYGYRERRLLLTAGVWTLVALVPALNLRVSLSDMHNNRFLYLAAVGCCMGIAVLIYSAVCSMSDARLRRAAIIVVGAFLVSCGTLTWVHLRPWHDVTVMIDELDRRMLRLMPPRHGGGLAWYVEDRPFFYKGAPGLGLFLGFTRGASNGDVPEVIEVESAVDAAQVVANDPRDAYTMRFAPITAEPHLRLDYLVGITNETEPPAGTNSGNNLIVWDFTGCDNAVLNSWTAIQARVSCIPGTGLKVKPESSDPQLLGPAVAVSSAGLGGQSVRLRAAVRYRGGVDLGHVSQRWYWAKEVGSFSEEQSSSLYGRQDGNFHVYWIFPQPSDLHEGIRQLRFDPTDGLGEVEIRWLAVDTVP